MLQILSGFLTLVAYVPYIAGVVRRNSRPNIVSWWIWAGVGFLLLSTYASVGGTAALGIAVGALIGQISVALLSLRYGVGGVSVLDKACLVGALIAALLWWITSSAFVPYILVLIIDFCAYLPTLRKSLDDPRSESFSAWVFWMAAALVSIANVGTWSVENALYPSYLVAANGLVLAVLLRRFAR